MNGDTIEFRVSVPASFTLSFPMHNTDAAELDKFEQLAASWWDPEGDSRPLHLLNPLRFDYIKHHATLSGQSVLDVGCGGGLLSELMAKAGGQVLGIDAGHAQISVAALHARDAGVTLEYEQTTAEQLRERQTAAFDLVTCMELLEHVPDPLSVVTACAELLRPGGKVIFSTINRSLGAWLKTIVAAEHVLGLLPKGTHRYENFIRPAELAAWGRAANLRVVDITGVNYNPVRQTFYLVPEPRANYMMCLARPIADD